MEGAFQDCHPSAPKTKRPGLLCLVSAPSPPTPHPRPLLCLAPSCLIWNRPVNQAGPAALLPLACSFSCCCPSRPAGTHGHFHHTQLCHFLQLSW